MDKQHGGLGMVDLNAFINAKYIKWIQRICMDDVSEWNSIRKFYLKGLDEQFNEDNFLLTCSSIIGMPSIRLPIYYWNCLAARCTLISKTEPGNKEEILNQNIFGNDQIGVTKKEGRRTIKQSLFYSNWAKSGIKTINDIWDNTENNWLPSKDILVKLTNKSNWMVEWLCIKKAIPQVWKQILMSKDVIEQEDEKLYTMPKMYNTKDVLHVKRESYRY